MTVRYTHTNIVARGWRRLVQFYQDVFGRRELLVARPQLCEALS